MVDYDVFVNVVKQRTVRADHNRVSAGCGGEISHPAGWATGDQHDVDVEGRRTIKRATSTDADLALGIQQRAI